MGHRPPPLALTALLVPVWSFCTSADTPRDPVDDSDGRTDAADSAEDTAIPGAIDHRRDIDGPFAFSGWPSEGTVVVACGKDALGKNLSGLAYQSASAVAGAVLWAVA
jgi:hypothetical protein